LARPAFVCGLLSRPRLQQIKKCFGFLLEDARALGIADEIVNFGHANPGVVHIALEFAERFRALDLGSIRIDDGIAASPG
jgi:hypothetical protein